MAELMKGKACLGFSRLCSSSAEALRGESPPLTSQLHQANVCIPLSRPHPAWLLEEFLPPCSPGLFYTARRTLLSAAWC